MLMADNKLKTQAIILDSSFTEKKRARLNLGMRSKEVLKTPYLLATQLHSYAEFLEGKQFDGQQKDSGLHAAFKSVFPIVSYSGHAQLEYVSYKLGEGLFDVRECKLRGLTYAAPLKVKMRLVIFDKESL